MAATIERLSRRGVDTCLVRHGGVTEASISVRINGERRLSELLAEAWSEVEALGAAVLRQTVFGIPSQHERAPAMLREACGEVSWPVTWLEEGASLGERLTGTQIHAVAGTEVRRIRDKEEILGSVYRDDYLEYAVLAGIVSPAAGADRVTQTRHVLERIEWVLRSLGMSFCDVIRTWFYNNRILAWYDGFNAIRTRFYDERGVLKGLVPASTGVGGSNLAGTALVAEALALRSLDPRPSAPFARAVGSPLQCPATDYRSSFSRAVELRLPGIRKLLVSGTAAIAPDGRTAHRGDVAAQIELTLDVIQALLEAESYAWRDTTRAIAYVKRGADSDVFRRVASARGIPALPVVITENDICRDDLLFEIEVDAVRLQEEG